MTPDWSGFAKTMAQTVARTRLTIKKATAKDLHEKGYINEQQLEEVTAMYNAAFIDELDRIDGVIKNEKTNPPKP